MALALSLGWQQGEVGGALGWPSPAVAPAACPLPAVDADGARCVGYTTPLWTESRGDRQRWTVHSSPLLFPHTLASLSDSGLYTISSELVGHFTASLENERGANKVTVRLKSCAPLPGVGCSSDCLGGGRGPLLLTWLFLDKRLERGLPHM